MTDHTPGPWTMELPSNLQSFGKPYYRIESGASFGYNMATGTGFMITAFMSAADARLIAAAPELLAALIALARDVHDLAPDLASYDHALDMIRRATTEGK